MIPITEIHPQNYLTDYKDWLDARKKDGTFKHNTVRAKEYAVDEFANYYRHHEQVINVDDFYGSVDTIKQFFGQTPVTKNKIAAVREFIGYIASQHPTEQAERLIDIQDRVKKSRIDGHTCGKTMRAKEIEDKILSDREWNAAQAVANPFEYLMIHCLMDTGCRPGELAALTPQDINYDVDKENVGATIKIEKTYSSDIGVQDHPKTDESIRTVNFRPNTAQMMQAWVDGQDIAEDALIFDSYRTVYDTFKDLFTFAHVKIGEDGITNLGPHSIRHNTCTRLRQRGVEKETVQQYMGHSSVTITEIYEHFNEDEVLEVHD